MHVVGVMRWQIGVFSLDLAAGGRGEALVAGVPFL
jgi:hypothetical protein